MRSYAFVLASMYRYSGLITFEIFQIFFFLIEGWVGGVYRIQSFFGFLYFFIFTRPLRQKNMLKQQKNGHSYNMSIILLPQSPHSKLQTENRNND